ncbi:MAG TPA: response regulator transcription factor [Candidatus Hydrogenedentes bacterium]|nr:response regulator transcription factor [Candidatus Hydrogenedentota bacterium]HRK34331.1 response regulator transcription factor [Candidatus Hydrogenedentota bacterium]
MQRPYKVLLVDDHPIIRQGLAELINREADMTVCAQAESGAAAIDLTEESQPDLALVDISLDDMNGLVLIKSLKSRQRNLRVLVLSMHDETLYAERALRAGAHGYIMKREAPTRVITGIRRVLSGEVYLSDELSARIMRKFANGSDGADESPVARLSDRELEVYNHIGQGLKTSQIASKLNLSVKTIETYREHIKEKLSLNDATELVQSAIKWVHGEGS